MIELTNYPCKVCVVGRCNFTTGIGMITYGVVEMLSRSFATCILPTEPELRTQDWVYLPNGRRVRVCKDPASVAVSFFCDVLWNGVHDFNYALMPPQSLKYAYLCYDSDQLPPRWTQLLNDHFDLIVASSPEMVKVARDSLVETPVAVLPIPLDLEPLLSRAAYIRSHGRKIRFGSVVAFHPRKGVHTLLQAFIASFGKLSEDAELVLHSNLAFGSELKAVNDLVAESGVDNVTITHGALTEAEKNSLIGTFDVFVNCSRGEGYSIGAREALALGKSLVLSDVGAHKDLAEVPGVFLIKSDVTFPARYPEIDNCIFGYQYAVRPEPTRRALEAAFDYAKSGACAETISSRRRAAHLFSFSRLATPFAMLVDPSIGDFKHYRSSSRLIRFDDAATAVVRKRLGERSSALGYERRRVIAAHDGGFFSIFNAFMNHLAWDIRDERCHSTLPDWDVSRFIEHAAGGKVTSFCYGQPEDGNIWTRLFEPLFGLTAEQMNDKAVLYDGAGPPFRGGDYVREPLMTYVHAYKLYRSRDFQAWRRQYHAVFKDYVHLVPALQSEVDAFASAHLKPAFMIAAHVRHPSHTVEQPGALIANAEAYIRKISETLRERAIDEKDGDWGVFLATDQEKVVKLFTEVYGERLCYFLDVRRTRSDEDAVFEKLSASEKNQDGFQLQHLVAASRNTWGLHMAWEVVRDAYCMARCHVLLHVVSNVSTAVSYMNPDLDMVFCSAA